MKIILTVSEIMERDIWIAICDIKDINEWAVNEGLLQPEDIIELSEDEARKIYLI